MTGAWSRSPFRCEAPLPHRRRDRGGKVLLWVCCYRTKPMSHTNLTPVPCPPPRERYWLNPKASVASTCGLVSRTSESRYSDFQQRRQVRPQGHEPCELAGCSTPTVVSILKPGSATMPNLTRELSLHFGAVGHSFDCSHCPHPSPSISPFASRLRTRELFKEKASQTLLFHSSLSVPMRHSYYIVRSSPRSAKSQSSLLSSIPAYTANLPQSRINESLHAKSQLVGLAYQGAWDKSGSSDHKAQKEILMSMSGM